MSNNSINNNKVVINVSNDKAAIFEAFLREQGLTIDDVKALVKKPADKFNFVDDNKTIASCNACGEEFNVNDIPEAFIEACRKQGICPSCAKKFAEVATLTASLKAKNISAKSGAKIVVNGGQQVAKRLRTAFADAIKSENFNEDVLIKLLDQDYSHDTLKFSSYPFLIDITDVSQEEIKENQNYYKRFAAKVYDLFGHKVRMCSQIYNAQFEASIAAFKSLNLIDESAQY